MVDFPARHSFVFGGIFYREKEMANISHLKMDGWKRILSLWDGLFFKREHVSFREGKMMYVLGPPAWFTVDKESIDF